MKETDNTPRSLLTPVIYFMACMVAALILLVAAFVSWLGEMVGSEAVALLMVGVAFLLLSWLVYSLSARHSIDYINERLDTIYGVAYAVRQGYRGVVSLLKTFGAELFH